MPTLAELAEQPIDWYAELGLAGRRREPGDGSLQPSEGSLKGRRYSPGGHEERDSSDPHYVPDPRYTRVDPRYAPDPRYGRGQMGATVWPPRPTPTDRIKNELHDLLCSGAQYEEERTKFIEQFKLGQAGFATAVTTVLVPSLGQAAPIAGIVVAVSLTTIGKVGLNSWCAEQKDRRAAFEAKAKRIEEALDTYRKLPDEAPSSEVRKRSAIPPGGRGRHRAE